MSNRAKAAIAVAAAAALFIALCAACGDQHRVRYLTELVAGWFGWRGK
jgi:hypothetical protein